MSADALLDPDCASRRRPRLRARRSPPHRNTGPAHPAGIRVDRPDSTPGHGITAEDCARLSRSLEACLEAAALVGPRYVLEVSSPGVERPVRWPSTGADSSGRRVTRACGAHAAGRPVRRDRRRADGRHVTVRLADGERGHAPARRHQERHAGLRLAGAAAQGRSASSAPGAPRDPGDRHHGWFDRNPWPRSAS